MFFTGGLKVNAPAHYRSTLSLRSIRGESRKPSQAASAESINSFFSDTSTNNEENASWLHLPLDRDKVLLNVSGERYETFESTLNKYPETLLGTLEKRTRLVDQRNDEIFLNRHREAFEAILFYYQSSGVLVRPTNLPMKDFVEECYFYDISEEAIKRMQQREFYLHQPRRKFPPAEKYKEFMKKCWIFLDHPKEFGHWVALLYFVVSYFLILLSITIYCMNTRLVVDLNKKDYKKYIRIASSIELVINILFAFEFMARFYVNPNRNTFLKKVVNCMELLMIFPYFMLQLLPNHYVTYILIDITRSLRVFRGVRLARVSIRLNIAIKIFRNSVEDLCTILLVALFLCIFCGSIMFIVEMEQPQTQFTSIPQSMWWAIQTIVCLGYGDIVPTSTPGKIVAPFLLFYGVVLITVLILALGNAFFDTYSREIYDKSFLPA